MFVRASANSGGGGGNYVEFGRSITSGLSIDLGFEPETLFVVYHAPNYTYKTNTIYWTNTKSTLQFYGAFTDSTTASGVAKTYAVPYTTSTSVSLILSMNGSVINLGYNSSLGANQTVDIIAFSPT